MVDLLSGVPVEPTRLNGVEIWPGWLSLDRQTEILGDVRRIAAAAPLTRYQTRRGRMSVAMTAAGDLGWMSDRSGYRYGAERGDGGAWPVIPASVLAVWRALSGVARDPDSCLVNYYGEGARMGLHQDRDEADTSWPVISISLGDDALFRVGQVATPAPSRSVWLRSGDVLRMAGDARLVHHGIDRIRFGSSALLPQGGRINLTLRVAGA